MYSIRCIFRFKINIKLDGIHCHLILPVCQNLVNIHENIYIFIQLNYYLIHIGKKWFLIQNWKNSDGIHLNCLVEVMVKTEHSPIPMNYYFLPMLKDKSIEKFSN